MAAVIIHGAQIPGTTHSPKHGRPGAQLWGCTRANIKYWGGKLGDWDAWCDVHPLTATNDFQGIPQRRPETWRWYCQQDGTRPIYLQAPEAHADVDAARRLFDQVPGARRFPIAEIQEFYKLRERWDAPLEPSRYFYCQVAMMMAFAGYLGFDTVVLNGIGQPRHVAHQHLHRDIGYWMGLLRGRGIDVVIDGSSTFLMPERLYAYDGHHFEELGAIREHGIHEREGEMFDRVMREVRRGRPVRRPQGV
jgi:hypothetical protein